MVIGNQRNSKLDEDTHRKSLNSASLLQERDRTIANLKLELAQSHKGRVDLENTTNHRIAELEVKLSGHQAASSTDIKLMSGQWIDDSESGNIKLNELAAGDPPMAEQFPLSAETFQAERVKSAGLEAEVLALKEQNNALTLYVNRIIARLLEQDQFEAMFEDGSITGNNPLNAANNTGHQGTNSSLQEERRISAAPTPPSLLKRSGSTLSGANPRPLPIASISASGSHLTSSSPLPSPGQPEYVINQPEHAVTVSAVPIHQNQDPNTSISIPLRRAESRRQPASRNADNVTPTEGSRQPSGHRSPNLQRMSSYFNTSGPASTIPPDGVDIPGLDSSAASDSGDTTPGNTPGGQRTVSTSSRPPSTSDRGTPPRSLNGPGTLFTASGPNAPNRMRPLRLVQEQAEADDAAAKERRKANRSSWVGGWFNSNKTNAASTSESSNTSTTSTPASKPGNMPPPPVPSRKALASPQMQNQWPGTEKSEDSVVQPQQSVREQWPS